MKSNKKGVYINVCKKKILDMSPGVKKYRIEIHNKKAQRQWAEVK